MTQVEPGGYLIISLLKINSFKGSSKTQQVKTNHQRFYGSQSRLGNIFSAVCPANAQTRVRWQTDRHFDGIIHLVRSPL